jgi:DNA-binding IclR family transcriptional regulator
MQGKGPRNPKVDRQFVTALARGLEVLRVFGPGEALANSEIAVRTGLPRPTISRLTYTLTKLGYLIQDTVSETYRPGSAVLSLGYGAVAGTDFRVTVRPYMQHVADFARSSCALGQCHNLEMIYIENCRGKNAPFTLGLDVGSRIPLARTAMGRAYLAGLHTSRRTEMLNLLARHHGRARKEIQMGVEHALRDYARQGFVLSIAEWTPEINAVAVPINFPGRIGLMALNCGGAASLLSPARLRNEVGPRLLEFKRRIEMLVSPQLEVQRA